MKIIQQQVANGFSGAVYVQSKKKILVREGFGNGVHISGHSSFWIASAGKQFTAAAILKCEQDGLLKLSDPISKFFLQAPADKRAITVEQLLAHTSGFDQSYVSENLHERSEALRRMLAEPLIDTPGNKFHYSNSNYQLAVAIIEVVTKTDYRTYMRKLWSQAGLRNTGFAGDLGSKRVTPTKTPLPPRLQTVFWGGEGVYSSADDLARWYGALVSHRILDAEHVRSLFTARTKISEGEGALGWFVRRTESGNKAVFTRGNEDFGANTSLYAYPDDKSVIIVLTHAGSPNEDLSWSRLLVGKIEAALLSN